MSSSHFRRTLNAVTVGALAVATSVAVPASLASAHSAKAHAPQASRSSILRGVVIARDAARHTLVLARGANGVATLRLRSASAVNAVSFGARLSAKASKLADGTFHVSSISSHGTVRRARLRATVVSSASGRLTLSAGGSVFAVAATSKRSAHNSSSSSSGVGDVVEVGVSIDASGLNETSLQQVGTSNLIQLEGTLSSVGATSIVLAVNEGASTTITVPASLTLPSTIVAGNQVEVLVDYSNSTFTLVTITDDSAASTSGASGVSSSDNGQSSAVEVEGLVVAANATSLTIQPGDQAAPVIITVPSSIDVSTLSVGARVHARADMVNGVLTLTSFQLQNSDGGDGQSMQTQVEGVVVSVSATSLVVQPGDQATPVTLAVPSTIDVSSISSGDRVHARGTIVNNVLTLSSFRVQGPANSDSSQSMEIDGSVTALSATSLTIQPGDQAAAITITVPSTIDVSSVQVGNEIRATATLVAGVLTLSNFELRGTGSSTVELSGVLSAVSSTSLSVLAGDNSQLVVLAVPPSVNVSTLVAGVHVSITATSVAGVLTVESIGVDS